MKYDDASWHYGGDFPSGLPDEAGATHIAMFVAWCVLNGMGGELHEVDSTEATNALKARALTPGHWFIQTCDEKFTDEDLSDEGNAFAADYYRADRNLASGAASYLSDYGKAFPRVANLYEVPDTWNSYDHIAPIIARRAMRWRARQSKPSWLRRWL
ncbi:hypothetical protein J2X45_001389 [Caulobacter sp. BE264]|uniref:DUF7832 domain-containing protein n=1 Tax=Caulobacter sp. BE264 TaxID=2817724 RepID=UPI0028606746|nr:hypothetical protein [Caulobacter sp. BE264]MDR7230308.1 hypothetical protein [Caulobacter sp. BE264]